jgi:hypothetical protein
MLSHLGGARCTAAGLEPVMTGCTVVGLATQPDPTAALVVIPLAAAALAVVELVIPA